MAWLILLECSVDSETSISTIQSLLNFSPISCWMSRVSHPHGKPKSSRRRSKWVLCCSICALFTGAAVSFEAQHVVYAGHGFLSAGCRFGRWRYHAWGTGDGDPAHPHGVPQKVQKAACKRAYHQVKRWSAVLLNASGVCECVIEQMCCLSSDLYELEGNACSVTDSTAEEHVLALVEHAADEARDRINRFMPNSKVQLSYNLMFLTLTKCYTRVENLGTTFELRVIQFAKNCGSIWVAIFILKCNMWNGNAIC